VEPVCAKPALLNEQEGRLKADGCEAQPLLINLFPTLDFLTGCCRGWLDFGCAARTFTRLEACCSSDGPERARASAVLDQAFAIHGCPLFPAGSRKDPAEPGILRGHEQGFAAAAPHDWLLVLGAR